MPVEDMGFRKLPISCIRTVAYFSEALRYMMEGFGFDSQIGNWCLSRYLVSCLDSEISTTNHPLGLGGGGNGAQGRQPNHNL
jgi:hypothetical protein